MSAETGRSYRAGDWLDDRCRPCKQVRRHTVLVAGEGRPLRVICDHCGSQHNYRGGEPARARAGSPRPAAARSSGEPLDLVSERETCTPAGEGGEMMSADLELLLRRVIREEAGLTPVAPAEKWRGGELILRPGREGVQEKALPIESFFHKIVMVRNRLRVLEQQINGTDLPEDIKLKLQGYVTACYGSLTSFNVLFANDEDRFHGSGGS